MGTLCVESSNGPYAAVGHVHHTHLHGMLCAGTNHRRAGSGPQPSTGAHPPPPAHSRSAFSGLRGQAEERMKKAMEGPTGPLKPRDESTGEEHWVLLLPLGGHPGRPWLGTAGSRPVSVAIARKQGSFQALYPKFQLSGHLVTSGREGQVCSLECLQASLGNGGNSQDMGALGRDW